MVFFRILCLHFALTVAVLRFKKKKKPKRVGGIAFAVEEQVQVIQTNQEDLTLRREHWQAIQEKANDPTTVSPGHCVVLAFKTKMVP